MGKRGKWTGLWKVCKKSKTCNDYYAMSSTACASLRSLEVAKKCHILTFRKAMASDMTLNVIAKMTVTLKKSP
jgi:hypothetical protein